MVNASSSTSEHKSMSSPDRQARFRKAKANESAVRDPIWAKPMVAIDPGIFAGELHIKIHVECGMYYKQVKLITLTLLV